MQAKNHLLTTYSGGVMHRRSHALKSTELKHQGTNTVPKDATLIITPEGDGMVLSIPSEKKALKVHDQTIGRRKAQTGIHTLSI